MSLGSIPGEKCRNITPSDFRTDYGLPLTGCNKKEAVNNFITAPHLIQYLTT